MKKPNRDRAERKVRIWEQYLKAGAAAREEYDKRAKLALEYCSSVHKHLYENTKKFLDFTKDGGLAVTSNTVEAIRSILCPYLYQRNPSRRVANRTTDPILQALGQLLDVYLNKTPKESNLEVELALAILDAAVRGRGYGRTVWDQELELWTSQYVSSVKVLVDPAAERFHEANWIAQRRRMPVWEVEAWLYPDERDRARNAWRLEGLKGNLRSASGAETESSGADPWDRDGAPITEGEGEIDYRSDLVELYEVWSKMGAGLVRGPAAPAEYEHDDDSLDFVKLVIVRGHKVPVYEGEWEVPLFVDRAWPLVPLDLVDGIDSQYPEAMFGTVLGNQQVVDLASSLELATAKANGREIWVVQPKLLKDENAVKRLIAGGPTEAIETRELDPGTKLSDVVYRVPTGTTNPSILAMRDHHMREIEKNTGITAQLSGAPDSGPGDRSATQSAQKQQAATTRTGDLIARVERWCSQLARQELLAVRLGEQADSDDVARVVGDVYLGWLVSVQGVAGELPLRDRSDDEDRREIGDEAQPLTMQDIAPEAAIYFADEESAAEATVMVEEALMLAAAAGDVRALDYQTLLPDGSIGFRAQPRRVTVDDVFRDTAGMSPKEIARECYADVEAGTAQRRDTAAKQQWATDLTTQVVPLFVSYGQATGRWGPFNAVMRAVQDAREIPPDERIPELEDLELAPPPGEEIPGMPGMEELPPGEAGAA